MYAIRSYYGIRSGLARVAEGRAEQDDPRPRAWPHAEVRRELDPVPNARLHPGALRDRSADQLEVVSFLADQHQDDAPGGLDADEIDARVCAQHAFVV